MSPDRRRAWKRADAQARKVGKLQGSNVRPPSAAVSKLAAKWREAIGTQAASLYAVGDHRHDGRPRIVSEHSDLRIAGAVAAIVRCAESDAHAQLLSPVGDSPYPCAEA